MSDENPCQCWDCGGTTFTIRFRDDGNVAECTSCGGRLHPDQLYAPDEHGREHYDVAMTHE